MTAFAPPANFKPPAGRSGQAVPDANNVIYNAGKTASTAPAASPAGLNGPGQYSASQLMADTLNAWGLSSLLPHLQEYLNKGYNQDTIALALQDTQEWKTRFAGNELRRKAGLSVLNPAQYIAVEEQYHQIMSTYGLPSKFYDSQDDFTKFIGGDVSPTELEQRVKIASDTWMNADPETKKAWQQYYHLTDGDAVASILDQNVALPVLQQRAAAVGIGAAAGQQGLTVDKTRAERFAEFGVSLDQARKAYGDIAQALPGFQAAGSRFGEDVGQSTLENAALLNDADAQRKEQRVAASEQSDFTGRAGANTSTLAAGNSY
jgi:hypothetical protein